MGPERLARERDGLVTEPPSLRAIPKEHGAGGHRCQTPELVRYVRYTSIPSEARYSAGVR